MTLRSAFLLIVAVIAISRGSPLVLGAAPSSVDIPSTNHWTASDLTVEKNKCYELVATGTWRGSDGATSGPEGTCPANAYSALGPAFDLKDTDLKQYYLGQHPKNALIAKFGTLDWSMLVGKHATFIAPADAKLSFRINDTDKPADIRGGRLHIILTQSRPQWVTRAGNVFINARIDAHDYLHIGEQGVFWEYGGTWGRVGMNNGFYPTIINGILWWPDWTSDKQSAVLAAKTLWPGKPEGITITSTVARRGDVKIDRTSAEEVVISFSDNGLGSSEVGCNLHIAQELTQGRKRHAGRSL